MHRPLRPDAAGLDMAAPGIPLGGRTTDRPGTRQMLAMLRRAPPVTRAGPYRLYRIAGIGELDIKPVDPMSAVEARTAECPAAGAWTLAAGGGQRLGRIATPTTFRRQRVP